MTWHTLVSLNELTTINEQTTLAPDGHFEFYVPGLIHLEGSISEAGLIEGEVYEVGQFNNDDIPILNDILLQFNGNIYDPAVDFDGDNIEDDSDNCIEFNNADQSDNDNDGIGDACDSSTAQPGIYLLFLDSAEIDSKLGFSTPYIEVDDSDGINIFVDFDEADFFWLSNSTIGGGNFYYYEEGLFYPKYYIDMTGTFSSDGTLQGSYEYSTDVDTTIGLFTGSLVNDVNDFDADGIANEIDNCLTIKNNDQIDIDEDGRGDACPLP